LGTSSSQDPPRGTPSTNQMAPGKPMVDQTGVVCGIDMTHRQTGTGSPQREGFGYVFVRADQGAGGQYGTSRDTESVRHSNTARRGPACLFLLGHRG